MSHREMNSLGRVSIGELPLNYGEFNLPPGISELPDDGCDDAITDAEVMILRRLAWHSALNHGRTRIGDECLGEVDGEWVEFRLPSIVVRVRRDRDAAVMAQDACEEFAIGFTGIEDVPREA